MDLKDLARWARVKGYDPPHVQTAQLARLNDFELVWNYRSKARKGGAANVRPAKGGVVWGVVLEVDVSTLEIIDTKEGHPGRYSRGEEPLDVEVVRDGRMVQAWVYQVTEAFLCDERVPPQKDYLEIILKAAREHGFPDEAIRSLEATPCSG